MRPVLLCIVVALLGGCASLPPNTQRTPSYAIDDGGDTPLARIYAPGLAEHPGESGLVLLGNNKAAMLARLRLADRATRTLDIQYYIIHGDQTGLALMSRALAAADRGVRVRLLVDDMYAVGNDAAIAAFDHHPMIEVRIFNPYAGRSGSGASRGWQMLTDGSRLTRRMHNKTYIADNEVAVVGGRNLGDEYFDAADTVNFNDLDVGIVGPVVAQLSRSFDDYWNSESAYPISTLHRKPVTDADLDAVRRTLDESFAQAGKSEYAQTLRELAEHRTAGPFEHMEWGRAVVIDDDPRKNLERGQGKAEYRMMPQVRAALDSARTEIRLISPYFVPGKIGTEYLVGRAGQGIAVRLLTNSLAANDVAAVHGGYSRYRKTLLAAGISIHELRPSPDRGTRRSGSGYGSSGDASLHAKSFTIDAKVAFVGSMNLDPRSSYLNTEVGVLVDSPGLAAKINALFDRMAEPTRSYSVILLPDKSLRWTWLDGTTEHSADRDPEASFGKRFLASLGRMLPVEGQL